MNELTGANYNSFPLPIRYDDLIDPSEHFRQIEKNIQETLQLETYPFGPLLLGCITTAEVIRLTQIFSQDNSLQYLTNFIEGSALLVGGLGIFFINTTEK